ncbi:LysR substrate-binding domain-containing protein [Variovorax sp. UMC13]|uniref:LysR substrate-binding domain-containing protein n=1 Tax=Variovorax sp. UMC13 TaxID=1862326 RepID=UPI001600F344|nr:LysR substrate-binding domain-containing protein [Variovorax sp. UMC13]MBB1603778.1 LysR family transcriptional regulator [Variovorax sp. UMC13]
MHFDLFDLRLFVFVAEASSLRRGAERACISLAAASARIRQLEDGIGSQLLYRHPQGVALSPAGEALLHRARLVLQQIDHLKCDLREYGAGIKGHVRILANTTAISSALPAALASFLARHPDVDIHLRERLSQQIVMDIHEARADIGIVAGDVDTQGLDVYDFTGEDLVVAVPQGHALAARARVSFTETLDEHHISLAEESALASFLPPLAKAIGRSLEFRIQVSSFESICQLVAAGVGIGIIPRSSAQRHARTMKLKVVALSDLWARRESKVVSRANATMPKLATDLIAHLANFNFEERLL